MTLQSGNRWPRNYLIYRVIRGSTRRKPAKKTEQITDTLPLWTFMTLVAGGLDIFAYWICEGTPLAWLFVYWFVIGSVLAFFGFRNAFRNRRLTQQAGPS